MQSILTIQGRIGIHPRVEVGGNNKLIVTIDGTPAATFDLHYGIAVVVEGLGRLVLRGNLPIAVEVQVAVKLGLHIKLDQNPSDLVSVMGGEYSYPILFLLACLVFLAGCAATIILSFVVQYRYAMSFLILAEYPEISVIDALRNSASLMRGNKGRLFCLQISFIGWVLLAGCCTCGIGVMFLTPYMSAANAAFYDDIANRAAARETEFPSLDPNDYTVD